MRPQKPAQGKNLPPREPGWIGSHPYLSALYKIVALAAFVAAAHLFSSWLISALHMELTPRTEPLIHRLIMLSVVAYGLLLAVPFVPGVEIGIALLVMGGASLAGLVYISTVSGLCLSFIIGRFIPERWLRSLFASLGFKRAHAMLEQLENLGPDERAAYLASHAPSKIVPFLLRHRYVALALAINLPGNALIGGGGGICLLAGVTRLYRIPVFILTLVVAVAPVPLLVYLFGTAFLQ